MEPDLQEILDGNVESIQAHVKTVSDPESIQAMIEAEEAGKARKGVLSALEAAADDLSKSPESAELRPATEPVDVDGFWSEVLQGDVPAIRRKIDQLSNEADLDTLVAMEKAGRRRAGVFMVLAQRRKALEQPAKRKGKVKPPVFLNEDGEVRAIKGVKLVGEAKVYEDRGYVAQVYDADLDGHNGRFKAHLSLHNGMPIGGTMGGYLDRIYADDGE